MIRWQREQRNELVRRLLKKLFDKQHMAPAALTMRDIMSLGVTAEVYKST